MQFYASNYHQHLLAKKIKTKTFGISYHNHVFFHDYNDLINCCKLFLVILLCRYKRYNIFLIWFFNLIELFPAFICTNNIGSVVNSLFGVKILLFVLLLFFNQLLVLACQMNLQILLYRPILLYFLTLHFNYVL